MPRRQQGERSAPRRCGSYAGPSPLTACAEVSHERLNVRAVRTQSDLFDAESRQGPPPSAYSLCGGGGVAGPFTLILRVNQHASARFRVSQSNDAHTRQVKLTGVRQADRREVM